MEKVKLPKEICEVLDSYPFSSDKGLFIWSAMQTGSINEKHSLYLVRRYIKDDDDNRTINIINAILYGYENEENEEIKEIEIKEQIKEYLEFRLVGNNDIIKKITNDLYNIAHGKK